MSEQPKKVSRRELFEKVWQTTLKRTSAELGISYVKLVRLCESLNVPRPPNGHWQRLKLGLPVELASLPEPDPHTPEEAIVKPGGSRKATAGRRAAEPEAKETVVETAQPAKSPNEATEALPQPEPTPKSAQPELPPVASAIMNHIRQKACVDFWADSLDWDLAEWQLADLLGLPEGHRRQVKSIIAEVAATKKSYDS
jgi:hypothetical protein